MQGNVDEAELTTIGYMHMCIYSQAGHVARRNGHPSSESSPVLFSSIRTFAGVFLRNGIGPDELSNKARHVFCFLAADTKLMEKLKWKKGAENVDESFS